MGMNTGIGDVVDLGWKLAAVAQGWGGPNLLASYVHLHFGQNPLLVEKFVQHCREYTAVRSHS